MLVDVLLTTISPSDELIINMNVNTYLLQLTLASTCSLLAAHLKKIICKTL